LLSSIEGKESEIINGEWAGNNIVEMIEVFMDDILGEHIFYTYGDTFPLLIKLIDTSEWLSIQVHPDDNWAKKLEKQQTCGKNELWYFIKTANNAQILHGLSRLADQDIIMKYLNEKNIEGIFRNINVSPHSYIYTPAGTVHALGPGLFLAEIQQTSDITYRIYDWDRPQDPKNPRPLHLDKAFKVINYDAIPEDLQYQPIIADRTVNLFNGENFVINRIVLSSGKQIEKDIEPFDSFFVYLILNGNGKIICDTYVVEIMAGDCCLIPACFSNVIIQSDKDILALEVYIQ
jgi:mannose-6-phosphate isomerase